MQKKDNEKPKITNIYKKKKTNKANEKERKHASINIMRGLVNIMIKSSKNKRKRKTKK